MDELYAEIKKSFSEMEKLFDAKQLNNFICCGYSSLFHFHFGLGTWIRNNLLNENCKLYELFISGGITQKDDMSSLVIHLFYIDTFTKYCSLQ